MRSPEDIPLAEAIMHEHAELFHEARVKERSDAREKIVEAQRRMKRQFDRKRRVPNVYEVVDLVAINRTQPFEFRSHLKIAMKFLGPYRLTRHKRNNRYDVEKVGFHDGPNRTTTCAEFMKQFISGDEDENSDDEVEMACVNDGNQHEAAVVTSSGPDDGQSGRMSHLK